MFLYAWNGPEEDIGCYCVATEFTIDLVENSGDRKIAKGTFTGKDYVEHGITFKNNWEAAGVFFSWQVRCSDDPRVSFNRNTGETFFTFNNEVNEGIKRFIGRRLNDFLAGRIAVVEKYAGPRDEYEGPCVCEKLLDSSARCPFPWQETTNGGRFPRHCFACSCGNKWWCHDPKNYGWVLVLDDAAWEMLTDYNGVEFQRLGCLEDGVYLFQTIRDKGYIPIP